MKKFRLPLIITLSLVLSVSCFHGAALSAFAQDAAIVDSDLPESPDLEEDSAAETSESFEPPAYEPEADPEISNADQNAEPGTSYEQDSDDLNTDPDAEPEMTYEPESEDSDTGTGTDAGPEASYEPDSDDLNTEAPDAEPETSYEPDSDDLNTEAPDAEPETPYEQDPEESMDADNPESDDTVQRNDDGLEAEPASGEGSSEKDTEEMIDGVSEPDDTRKATALSDEYMVLPVPEDGNAEGAFYYTGFEKTPEVLVGMRADYDETSHSFSSPVLQQDIDYSVSYNNNLNAGTADVIVTGIGDYTGSITASFKIQKAEISGNENPPEGAETTLTEYCPAGLRYELQYISTVLSEESDYAAEEQPEDEETAVEGSLEGDGSIEGNEAADGDGSVEDNEAADGDGSVEDNGSVEGDGFAEGDGSVEQEEIKYFTNPVTVNTDGEIFFSSDNPDVATIDSTTGEVTIQGAGEAVITAEVSEGTNYLAGTVSYTVFVTTDQEDHTVTPENAFASGMIGDYWYWSQESENETEAGTIYWYIGKDGTLNIYGDGELPSTGGIDGPWYLYKEDICSVAVYDGIGNIPDGFMKYGASYPNLEAVTIPSSVSVIGNDAFRNCQAVNEVVFPDGVVSIGTGTFSACENLEKAIIPDTVLSISDTSLTDETADLQPAFSECPLLVIYGQEGSEAERYANENGIPFSALSPANVDESEDPQNEIIPDEDSLTPSEDGEEGEKTKDSDEPSSVQEDKTSEDPSEAGEEGEKSTNSDEPSSGQEDKTSETEDDQSNNANAVTGEQEEWVYTPKRRKLMAKSAGGSSSANLVEVTVNAEQRSDGTTVPVEGATVNLYVGSELRVTAPEPTNSEGKATLSLEGISVADRKNATISAYKQVAQGKGVSGTARDPLFQDFTENGEIIRYKYELHSETIDSYGNWLGKKLPEAPETNKVDIAFAIDATGSMSSEINSVKDNVAAFSEALLEQGLDIRFSIIEYRDTTCGEETKIHTLSGSHWFTELSSVTGALSEIRADGGGDTDETVIDALGKVASDTMFWRSGAYRFAFVLTDAGYKTDNQYGYSSLADITDALKTKEIVTSVITTSGNKSKYTSLYEGTGGIYADINSSSFKDEMLALADNIVKTTTREMTLTLSEPRVKYNLAVCYYADDDTSRSEAYRNDLKTMLNEYANDVAETTDGHVLINKILLFSEGNRMNFFNSDSRAAMADIQIQTKVNDSQNTSSNRMIHSNAYLTGYYRADTVQASSSTGDNRFLNLTKDERDRYSKGSGGYMRIQLGGTTACNYGWESFSEAAGVYAETLTHETGHYIFGFYDEYLKEDNKTKWEASDKPYEEFGLMDHQNKDIEMSKRLIDYYYLWGSFPDTDDSRPHTAQSYLNGGSCEDTLAYLLEEGKWPHGISMDKDNGVTDVWSLCLDDIGPYKAHYSKSTSTSDDRRAPYSYAGLTEDSYISPDGGVRRAAARRLAGGTADSVQTYEALSDLTVSFTGDSANVSLSEMPGMTYQLEVRYMGEEDFEAVELTSEGGMLRASFEALPGTVAELRLYRIPEDGSPEYNVYYLSRSEITDVGYIYESPDGCTAAYANVADTGIVSFVADNTPKANGDYAAVNQATHVSATAELTGGEIYSVAAIDENINFDSLSWFRYSDGSWTPLPTDLSREENLNVGARADLAGEGIYVLMALPSSEEAALALSDISVIPSPGREGFVTITFNDPNQDTALYNVYYSDHPLESLDADNVIMRSFEANGESISLNLFDKNRTVYLALVAVLSDGRRSEPAYAEAFTGEADSDGDGIPDWYCDKYLLWPADGEEKDIAGSDDDGDGLTNLEEYLGGSNPKDMNDPVYTGEIAAESISMDQASLAMEIKETATLSASVFPENATNQAVIWACEDPKILKLTPDGEKCSLTAIGSGTTLVYAVSEDGGYSASCEVNVHCDHVYETTWTVDTPATMSSTGYKSHHCRNCQVSKDLTTIPRISSVSLSSTRIFRDGTKKTPAVTVSDSSGNKLVKGTDYTLKYSSSERTAAGTYTVTIVFKDTYAGSVVRSFDLVDRVSGFYRYSFSLGQAEFRWDALAGVTGYKFYRKTGSSGKYTLLATLKKTATTYIDKKVIPNKEYYYTVIPYNDNKSGKKSSELYLNAAVSVPSLYVYTDDATGLPYANVYYSSDYSGYQLYRSTSEDGKYSLVKASSCRTIYDSGLAVGKTYYYKARSLAYFNGKAYYSAFTNVQSREVIVPAPSSPTACGSGNNQIYVEWNASQDATGYIVYRCESSYGTYTKIGTTKRTYFTDKGLTADKYYYYKIAAYRTVSNKNYPSPMSSYGSAKTGFSKPYNVTFTSKSLSTTLIRWKKPANVTGVELSCYDSTAGDYKVLANVTDTSGAYTHKKLVSSNSYSYRLRSYKTVSGEKVYSDAVYNSYRPQIAGATNLKARNASSTSVKLTWTMPTNATIAYISRSTSLNGYYSQIGSSETNSYLVENLETGSTLYFKVTAARNVNGSQNYGPESDPVKVTVLPAAPKISSVTPVSATGLKITWKKTAEATTYNLYTSTSKSGKYSLVKAGLKTVSYTHTKRTPGKTYYYRVRAVLVKNGISTSSGYSTAVGKKMLPPDVKNVKAVPSKNSVKITWTAVSGAKGYVVYKYNSGTKKYSAVATTTKNSVTIKSLKPGVSYTYYVRSMSKNGNTKVYSQNYVKVKVTTKR